jgi:hypothetical protein
MRNVPPLSETDKKELTSLFKHHNTHSVRRRAHAVLLSAKGFTIDGQKRTDFVIQTS